jgi:hypothetical protein
MAGGIIHAVQGSKVALKLAEALEACKRIQYARF